MSAFLTDQLAASLCFAYSSPQAEIRRLQAEWENALRAKDLDRLMALYSRDIALFDVQPPFRTDGLAAVRELWETALPAFPEGFHIETRRLSLTAGEDTAFAHWQFRIVSEEPHENLVPTWLRVSAGYRKLHGEWKIVHEHVSLPVDPTTQEAVPAIEI